PTAGGFIGIICALLIMVTGGLWLGRMVNKAVAKGETFSPPNESAEAIGAEVPGEYMKGDLPNIIVSVLPLIVVIVLLNILGQFMNPTTALLIALTTGIFLACTLMYKFLKEFW